MKLRLRVLFLFVITFFASVANSSAGELVFAHIGAPGSLYDATAQEFARRVNARLQDKVHIEVFGNSAMGNDAVNLEKLKSGKIEVALVAPTMSSVDDIFGVFELPFLIRDRAHMMRVRAALFEDTLQPAAKAKGYRLLAVWELGFRHIANNVRPVRYPEDLKGLRLRVPKVKWLVKAFEQFGATTVPIVFDNINDEIAKGSIDGLETALEIGYAAHVYEHQKYLSLSRHLYSPAFLLVNEEQFSKLPNDVQDSITEIAVGLEPWAYKAGEQRDRETLQKLQASLKINEVDLIEFYQAAATGIYRDFAKSVPAGGELIKRIEALANTGG